MFAPTRLWKSLYATAYSKNTTGDVSDTTVFVVYKNRIKQKW